MSFKLKKLINFNVETTSRVKKCTCALYMTDSKYTYTKYQSDAAQ